MAMMAAGPAGSAVATPGVGLTVATAGLLDIHVAAAIVEDPITAVWLVRFTVVPADEVPMAMNCAVWLIARACCVAGTIASETSGSGEPVIFTVSVAVPVTAVPSGL